MKTYEEEPEALARTREHDGKIYRRLEVGELVKKGDMSSPTTSVTGTLSPCSASLRISSGGKYHWRLSEIHTTRLGFHWRRLKAGELIEEGDRQGETAPINKAPDGYKVRKSRHVWRKGVLYKASRQSAKVSGYSGTFVGTLLAPHMSGKFWANPDKYTDSDGRPWRRLQDGDRIRPCDRQGELGPNLNQPPVGTHVRSLRWVWRPAGPPVKKTTPPPKGFLDYLRDCNVTVDGYTPADLVRWIEGVS